ncbi:DUF483 domain-containing protein [Nanoarchaeota archaeon]
MFIWKDKPNREVYKSAAWRSIDPVDRAHIILVVEGLKPMAYCDSSDVESIKDYLSSELKIFFTEARGLRKYWRINPGLVLPSKVYTVCANKKILNTVLDLNDSAFWNHDLFGKLLGYPECCRKEYSNPTYEEKFNGGILKFFEPPYAHKAFTFEIEYVQKLLEEKKIPEEFLYLMPSQTPCSIDCKKSRKLLSKWKHILEKYDPRAAKALREFNEENCDKEYKELAKKLKKKGIKPEMFRKGYIFTS